MVVHKSGGPAMLVIEAEGPVCLWVSQGTYRMEKLHSSELVTLQTWMEIALNKNSQKKRNGKEYGKERIETIECEPRARGGGYD